MSGEQSGPIKNDQDLLQEITSLCQDEKPPGLYKLEQPSTQGGLLFGASSELQNTSGEQGREEDMFNMSQIIHRANETDFNMVENIELNQLISQFTKVDLRLMEEILDKMR